MKIRYLLLFLLLCFEAANLTGFSWTSLRRLSDEALINAAISYNYPDIYSNLAELRADYSSFSPEVHYWHDLTGEAGNLLFNKLLGSKHFQVRLPDAVVVVASNGMARFSRKCGENAWCSPTIAPDRPTLGIVGKVQNGPPGYEPATQFSVRWVNGSEGSVIVSGNCFAAFSRSLQPALRISAAGDDEGLTIGDQYGYRLINMPDIKRAAYESLKVPEREFSRLQVCDRGVQAITPSGNWWQRR